MYKRAEDIGIDPATAMWMPEPEGKRTVIAGTPVGKTGPMSQTPTGRMVAASQKDAAYEAGFVTKCAAAGVDPEWLVKQAINWSSVWGTAKPILNYLNPLNMYRGTKGLFKGWKDLGQRSAAIGASLNAARKFPLSAARLQELTAKAMKGDAAAKTIRSNMWNSAKGLAGGTASTAGLLGGGYAMARPEPEPDPETPSAYLSMMNDRIKNYFSNMVH